MKPNFALNLSHDGLTLLHRAATGWHRVSEVPLDNHSLSDDLAQLRKQAQELATSDITTKLIIPESQILYHTMPDPGDAERENAIRSALDGATPYALKDLIWDHRLENGDLQLAVVARETLIEAENFATEHGFNPVSFAAWPTADNFVGEPYFGRSTTADAVIGAETEVEPDHDAIQIIPDPLTEPPMLLSTPVVLAEPPETEPTAKDEPTKTDSALVSAPSPASPPQDAPNPTDVAASLTPETGEESLTVFGARRTTPPSGANRARVLGFGVAAVCVILTGVGVFGGLGNRAPKDTPPVELTIDMAEVTPDELGMEPEAEVEADDDLNPETNIETTNVETEITSGSDLIENTAPPALPVQVTPMSPEERARLAEQYTVTGIWPLAPETQKSPIAEDGLVDLYSASIDPKITSQDAVALADVADHERSADLPPRVTTVAPGTQFDLDEDGFIRATKAGIVTPEGVWVFAGRPSKTTAPRPERASTPLHSVVETATDPNNPIRQSLASARPTYRPTALLESTERAQLGGLTRAQLGAFRPTLRPNTKQDSVTTEAEKPEASAPTAPVVTASERPKPRPQDINKLVAAAAAAAKAANTPPTAGKTATSSSANKVTARVPDTQLPSSAPASVAQAATNSNAINLRRLNLMGVYGASKDRRALIRLPSGKFVKVKVGDRLDGGRVQSIETSSLTYVRNGRAQTLKIGG